MRLVNVDPLPITQVHVLRRDTRKGLRLLRAPDHNSRDSRVGWGLGRRDTLYEEGTETNLYLDSSGSLGVDVGGVARLIGTQFTIPSLFEVVIFIEVLSPSKLRRTEAHPLTEKGVVSDPPRTLCVDFEVYFSCLGQLRGSESPFLTSSLRSINNLLPSNKTTGLAGKRPCRPDM